MLPFTAEGECPSTRVFPKMLTDGFGFLSTFCRFTLPPREESHVTGRQERREVREPALVNDRFSHFQGTCCLDEFFWFVVGPKIKMYLCLRDFLLFVVPYLLCFPTLYFNIYFPHHIRVSSSLTLSTYTTVSCIIAIRHILISKSVSIWDIAPCNTLKINPCFGGTCRLYVKGRRISRTGSQRESRWQAEQLQEICDKKCAIASRISPYRICGHWECPVGAVRRHCDTLRPTNTPYSPISIVMG